MPLWWVSFCLRQKVQFVWIAYCDLCALSNFICRLCYPITLSSFPRNLVPQTVFVILKLAKKVSSTSSGLFPSSAPIPSKSSCRSMSTDACLFVCVERRLSRKRLTWTGSTPARVVTLDNRWQPTDGCHWQRFPLTHRRTECIPLYPPPATDADAECAARFFESPLCVRFPISPLSE